MYIKPALTRGYTPYLQLPKSDHGARMGAGLLILEAGDNFTFREPEQEIALDVLEGKVEFSWLNSTKLCERKDAFHSPAYCLHVCCGTQVEIRAKAHSEVYVQTVENDREFPCRMIEPDNVFVQRLGNKNELLGCMQRDIRTFFDFECAPYANMAMGEILTYPGKWSYYPPHYHPQPEIGFYRFNPIQGFGVGFANDRVYKVEHNGLLVVNHGIHPQVTAPGYAMCVVWGIRHLEDNPWRKTRIDIPEYAWLWEDDANEHILH